MKMTPGRWLWCAFTIVYLCFALFLNIFATMALVYHVLPWFTTLVGVLNIWIRKSDEQAECEVAESDLCRHCDDGGREPDDLSS